MPEASPASGELQLPNGPVRLDDIIEQVRSYAPDADVDLLQRAYVVGRDSHAGQMRKSGDAYFVHPVGVALICAELHLDIDSIACAFLHDTVEDTDLSIADVKRDFGPDLAAMVDGVTKLSKLEFDSKGAHQAESFRKLIFAMSNDIRVILVKLADRLHNMRTLEHMRAMKQVRIARETMEIYAPIANRLGLRNLKEELENRSFRYLQPAAYQELAASLKEREQEHREIITQLSNELREQSLEMAENVVVQGRVKSMFSVYKKMLKKNLRFEDVHDILALRAIVEKLPECYAVLGVAHSTWPPISERFKDYIAHPKANGYRSLHTTVLGPKHLRLEVQIRTREMHDFAENGIAAHWHYKEGHLNLAKSEIARITQLRRLVQLAEDVDDPVEFLETVKVDLFNEEVYVFTPKGEVRWFPPGATPLDFAYSIHTEVGEHCSGARVDGRIVRLNHQLQPGETVEVLTRKDARPNRDWLDMVVTSRARSKIRAYLRRAERLKAREVGMDALDKALRKRSSSLKRIRKADGLQKAVEQLPIQTPEELFHQIGFGVLDVQKVIEALGDLVPASSEPKPGGAEKSPRMLSTLVKALKKKQRNDVRIEGMDHVLVVYAKCCKPLPGDEVFGIISRNRGVVVHRSDCPNVMSVDSGRRLSVDWESSRDTAHEAVIKVLCTDRKGMLADLTKVISKADLSIAGADARTTANNLGMLTFRLRVHDTEELQRCIQSLQRQKGVVSVERSTVS